MRGLRSRLALGLGGAAFCVLCAAGTAAARCLPCAAPLSLCAAVFVQAPQAAWRMAGAAVPSAARPGRPGWAAENHSGKQEADATAVPTIQPTATPTPTEVPSPSPMPTPSPTQPAEDAPTLTDPGKIRAEQYGQGHGTGFVSLTAGSIRNMTRESDATLRAAATGALPFEIEVNSREPQVLILHTHATEAYQSWQEAVYDKSYTARTGNTELNMCEVGAAMERVLDAAGINTLHDTTLYDDPSYTESYDRSAAGTQEILRKHPSIRVVLDVHRDAIEDEDGTRVKPLCTVEGEPTAQVMIIAGCDNGTTAPLPNWRLNLRFAAAWEAAMESQCPGLTRPVLCAYRYYNQDLSTGSLLIEIGGHGNTLAEAVRAGEYAARALAGLLGGNA